MSSKTLIENSWMLIKIVGLTIFLGIAILLGAKDPFQEKSDEP